MLGKMFLIGFLSVIIGIQSLGQCEYDASRNDLCSRAMKNKLLKSNNSILDSIVLVYKHKFNDILKIKINGIYFMDSCDNAFANRRDSTIELGLSYLQPFIDEKEGSYQETWNYRIALIVAHEMSHLYQYQHAKHNPYLKLKKSKYRELQADFLAGFLLSKSKVLPEKERNLFLHELVFDKHGDFQFDNLLHHGTPLQRTNAIESGCKLQAKPLGNVYAASYLIITPQIDSAGNIGKSEIVGECKFKDGKIYYLDYETNVFIKKNGILIQVGSYKPFENSLGDIDIVVTIGHRQVYYHLKNLIVYDANNRECGVFHKI